jgi:heat shock protein HtpX
MQNIYESVGSNKRKSVFITLIFFVFTALSVYFIASAMNYWYGYEAGGLGIVGMAMIISGISTFIGYYFSDKIVLSISQARPADKIKDRLFYTVTENLVIGSGLPMPKLYVIEDGAPNAFATGRNPENAVVCATTGLLEKLDRTELEGVIAHELSHIKNYDIRLMSVVAVLVGSIALLADIFLRVRFSGGRRDNDSGSIGVILFVVGILFAILSPIIANLIKLAISRRREFLADAGSVAITRQPQGLIDALLKISQDPEPLEAANKATAHLYIENPFKNKIEDSRSKFANLFNTHPPLEERLSALKAMA